MRRVGVAAVALAIWATACGSSNQAPPSPPSAQGTGTSSPSSSGPPPTQASGGPNLSRVRVRLVQVTTLQQPVAFADRAGDRALYIAEKTGKVMAIRNGRVDPTAVLDLSGEVSHGGEQGLLGVAFSPAGNVLYVNFTDASGNTNVVEFAMRGGRAVPSSRRLVLFVHQPFANHNGGDLAFGPDGYLYIGLGDGGSEGDPLDNGQRLDTLLGKMLRIDPHPSGRQAYTVPSSNPFVGRAGVRSEIWAYGLRNPWRYSFDRQTGDLWIGDVGQNTWEEIDVQPAGSRGGQNYGWNRMEGNHPFRGSAPPNAVGPVLEYNHSGGGCAVVGGYVYRGSAIPALRGAYLFGDDCLAPIVAIVRAGGRIVQRRTLPIAVSSLSSFGEDRNGELYALSLGGAVYKIVPQG